MANKRIPDKVHQLKGTFQPHRHGDRDKPVLDTQLPERPPELDGYAAAEWNRIAAILENWKVATLLDRTVMIQYCLMYKELMSNPSEFTAAQHTQLRMLCAELGFTPSSRSKVVPIDTDSGKPTGFAALRPDCDKNNPFNFI